MSIRFRCPFCKKPLKLVNNEKVGQPMQCPNPVCKKWIVFTDEGLPQESASAPPPPVGTRPQPQNEWLRVDGIDDDNQFKKIKRAPIPTSIPPRLRSQSFDRRVADEDSDQTDHLEQDDLPPALPSRRNGESEPPAFPRGGSRAAPPLPPPPPRTAARRTPVDSRGGGGRKTLLVAILLLLIVGAGVAGYFVFTKENEPVFVKKDYGIIEISTTSIKALVVRPFPVGDSYDFEMVKEFDSLAISAAKLQEDGKAFDPKTLEQAMSHVQSFYELFQKEPYSLPPERIAIIRSSGVVAGFEDVKSLDTNRKLLVEKVRERTGLKLDPLSPEDEGKYITRFVIPEREIPEAMLLDIGGGNIKGGLFDESGLYISTDVSTGTSRFTKEVEKAAKPDRSDFQAIAAALSRSLVYDKIRVELANTPQLRERKKIYLCGGITWVWRTFARPNAPEQLLVEMTHDDIDKLRKLVVGNSMEEAEAKVLAEVTDERQREFIGKQIKSIKKKFTIEQVRAGVEILAATSDAYEFPKKQLLFYSKGPAAPNMGYLLYRLGLFK